MNQLALVNRVLIKLRQQIATSVNDSAYTALIAEFVNETMKEVQDSWNWTSLRQELSLTTAPSTSSYALTGSTRDTVVLHEDEVPAVYNVTNASYMRKVDYNWMRMQYLISTQQPGSPTYWSPDGLAGGELKLKVYPEPDAAETITFLCKVPQGELELDGTDDATEVTLEANPIILGAYYRAVEERGEDGGTSTNKAYANYLEAWSTAVAIDQARTGEETRWRVG